MMEPNENNLRRSADQEFIESLNQLENILHETENQREKKPDPKSTPEDTSTLDTTKNPGEQGDSSEIDLAAWEDAVADIEQYLEKQTQAESSN